MCAQSKLNPPHGFDDIQIPFLDTVKREFFVMASEHDDFHRASSEREQVHLLAHWAQMQSRTRISLQDIADFLNVGKGTVAWHLTKPFEFGERCEPLPSGRPTVIPCNVLQQLTEYIVEAFNLHVPLTYEDIRERLSTEFDIQVQIDTLRKFLRRSSDFRVVQGIPMEDNRLFCSPEKIDEYFKKLEEVIAVGMIPSSFIMNLDEAGFDSYVDARRIKRVVPSSFQQTQVPTPVSRQEKRATLLAAICADGHCLRPMVILLLDYEGPALLIMDGFGVHTSSAFELLCEEENVVIVFIPPHTSDQLQPCDLGLFAVLKRWQSNIALPAHLNKQTRQVVRMLDGLRMATTPKNVIGAFRKAGIVGQFSLEKGQMLATVDPSQATAVRHFQSHAPIQDRGMNPKQRVRI